MLLQHKVSQSPPMESQEHSIYPKNETVSFPGDKVPLLFVPSSVQYAKNTAIKNISHTSILQIAIHIWKPSETGEAVLETAEYSNHGYIASKHPSWTNYLDNIPMFEGDEKVMGRTEGEGGTVEAVTEECGFAEAVVRTVQIEG